MKRVIATTAVLLAAFGLAAQVQARDHGNESRGWQDRDRGGHDYRPSWNERGRDYGRGYGRDHDGWRDHDEHHWGAPYYRDYGYHYPRHYYGRPYYNRPYYADNWRYYRPPVYRSGYYYDWDDCDDDGFSILFSLPLR